MAREMAGKQMTADFTDKNICHKWVPRGPMTCYNKETRQKKIKPISFSFFLAVRLVIGCVATGPLATVSLYAASPSCSAVQSDSTGMKSTNY